MTRTRLYGRAGRLASDDETAPLCIRMEGENVHSCITYNWQGMKQHRCPSADKWIKKMWCVCVCVCVCVYNGILDI